MRFPFATTDMTWLRAAALLMVLAWSQSALAAPPTAEQVAALVQRLGATRQVDRAGAARELEALGPAALPHLPTTDAVDDPAVRDALSRLRKSLEKRLAIESMQSTIVSLQGRPSISEMLAELQAQSRNRVGLAAGIDPPEGFSVDWRKVGFWTAIDAIHFARGWHPRWDAEGGRWELTPETEDNRDLATAVSGPFRVVVRKVAWKELPDSKTRLLRVDVVVQAESRLRPLFLAVSPGDWSAQINAMRLSAWNPTAKYELSFGEGGCEVAWNLDLVAPEEITKSDAISLSGKAKVHIAAGTEPFMFDADRLQRGATQRRGDVSVRVRPAKFGADADGTRQLTVRMTLSYPRGGPAFESHRVGMFHRSARLETTTGTTIPFDRFEVATEADGGVALEYHFRGLVGTGANYRFAYEAPTLLLDAPVVVEFARIPVPK